MRVITNRFLRLRVGGTLRGTFVCCHTRRIVRAICLADIDRTQNLPPKAKQTATFLNAGVSLKMHGMETKDTPKTAMLPADDPRSEANITRRQALGIAERDTLGRLLPGSILPGAASSLIKIDPGFAQKADPGGKKRIAQKSAFLPVFDRCLFGMGKSAEMPHFHPYPSIHAPSRRKGFAAPSRKCRLALDSAHSHQVLLLCLRLHIQGS